MQIKLKRSLGIRLVGLARRWRHCLDDNLAAAGLSDATWAPLIHLEESGDGLWQKDLARLVGVEGSSLVRLLDILEAGEMIERRPDPLDRRAKRIFLTQAGRLAVVGIRRQIEQIEDDMLCDLADDDIAVMLSAFERIETRISAIPASGGRDV